MTKPDTSNDLIRHVELPVKNSRHSVLVDVDSISLEVRMAKVLNGDTGVRLRINDDDTLIALANIFIAEKVADDARRAAVMKQQEMDKIFTPSVKALPADNPAVKPHYDELRANESRAENYGNLARFFENKVTHRAYNIAEGHEPQHGLTVIANPASGSDKGIV